MKTKTVVLGLILVLSTSSCITEFIPEVSEVTDQLVVEGLLTDQTGPNKIKLSLVSPLDVSLHSIPVHGAQVFIRDDLSNTYQLQEKEPGQYYTNPSSFQGTPGRKYALVLNTYNGSYASDFMEMIPCPDIDSIYYEKILIRTNALGQPIEGCQIYADTHDNLNTSRFFRWNYSETWEIRIPYNVPNNRCWITLNSSKILIKNTSYLADSRVSRFPINKISAEADDRIKVKYSILVNQYSLNDEEFRYWEKLQRIYQESGGLYDVPPATVKGNIQCLDNPEEQVLGFFSVSSVSSSRIFIKDIFRGFKDLYASCPYATIPIDQPIVYLDSIYWVIIWDTEAGTKTYTDQFRCYDCTTRGTIEKPDFW